MPIDRQRYASAANSPLPSAAPYRAGVELVDAGRTTMQSAASDSNAYSGSDIVFCVNCAQNGARSAATAPMSGNQGGKVDARRISRNAAKPAAAPHAALRICMAGRLRGNPWAQRQMSERTNGYSGGYF